MKILNKIFAKALFATNKHTDYFNNVHEVIMKQMMKFIS